MEEELRRSQATNERVLDEATSLGAVIVLLEVGEGAILEAIRDALALNILLPNTRNHLRNIDGATLGSSTNHRRHAVLGAQRRLANLACQLRRLVQDAEHLVLQLITIRLARVIVKEILVNLEEQCLNLCLAGLDLLVHLLLRRLIRNQVADANREAVVDKELLDRVLETVNQICRLLAAIVIVGHVNDTTTRLTEDSLVNLPL